VNQINVIHPYRFKDQWVFDDKDRGLLKEPFVGGADTILDTLTANIPNAGKGITVIFSASAFPGCQSALMWYSVDEKYGGNWYYEEGSQQWGWLCPALMKYFDEAPKTIYFQVKEKK
jgi:hypothetical protein